MTSTGLSVGDHVAACTVHLTRESLVRYAGASGDFNPIHYRDDVAERVGLPGVLAHGMLTMGLAVETIVPWLGLGGSVIPGPGGSRTPGTRERRIWKSVGGTCDPVRPAVLRNPRNVAT